jgi:hypothetical protein
MPTRQRSPLYRATSPRVLHSKAARISNSPNLTPPVKTQPHLTRHGLQVTPKRATQLTDRDQTLDLFMFPCHVFSNLFYDTTSIFCLFNLLHLLEVVVSFYCFGGKFKKAEKFSFLINFCSMPCLNIYSLDVDTPKKRRSEVKCLGSFYPHN